VPINPMQLTHDGPHIHSTDPKAFHYCEEQCDHCGYYCNLPLGRLSSCGLDHPLHIMLGHPQKEHDTAHGSMAQTEWIVGGNKNAALELDGRKYGSGAPMLCSLLCKTMGRHVHVADCRAKNPGECKEDGVEHVWRGGAKKDEDWITHRLFWARSRKPYL
jgi:hypothetical protein